MAAKDRLFYTVLILLILLHLANIWSARLLPFIDLPFRLAEATIIRNYGETDNQFDRFYKIEPFPKPNVVYILFCSSRIFPDVESANKAFYTLYLLLLSISALLVIRKIRGSPWLGLLFFLLVYNYSVIWGFSEFTLAIPLVIFFWLILVDYISRQTVGGQLALGALLVLLFFCHVIAALFSFALFLLAVIMSRGARSRGGMMRNLITTIPFIFLAASWWFTDTLHNHTSNLEQYLKYLSSEWLGGLGERTRLIYVDNFSLFSGITGKITALLFTVVIIFPFLVYFIRRYRGTLEIKRIPRLYWAFPLTALFFFFLMPPRIFGNYYIYPRFAVFFWLGVLFIGSFLLRNTLNRVVPWLVILVCFIHAAFWFDHFQGFNRENRGFSAEYLPGNTEEQVLAGLIYDNEYRGRPSYIHFSNYHITWNQGITATCMIDFSFGTVRRLAGYKELPSTLKLEWIGRHGNYNGEFSGVDYLLIRGEIPLGHLHFFRDFILIGTSGRWELYRNQNH